MLCLVLWSGAAALPGQGHEDRVLALRRHVERAEVLREQGETAAARAAAQAAWQSVAAIGEATGGDRVQRLVWRLGGVAEDAHALQIMHDAYALCHEHRRRMLPDDHEDLQNARLNLGAAKMQRRDLRGALALTEKVYEVWSRTLPDDHADVQTARLNLGAIRMQLGDLHGALPLNQKVYDAWRRTLPEDHSDLRKARNNLAANKGMLGDMQGAHDLFEEAYRINSRILADDDPHLQGARNNLATAKRSLGDLRGALRLSEKVHEVWQRVLPDDHPDLQDARTNLARIRTELGDPAALPLAEKALEVWSRRVPDDHRELQDARNVLAAARRAAGDVRGARLLHEKVLEVRSRKLPADHPELQAARYSLSVSLYDLGELERARGLLEQVHEIRSRTVPEHDRDLQRTRQGLCAVKHKLGDLAGALPLAEAVFRVYRATLPPDHPELLLAGYSLAMLKFAGGDRDGVLELLEWVHEGQQRVLPADHHWLQLTRLGLSRLLLESDPRAAHDLARKAHDVVRGALPDTDPLLQQARANLALAKAAVGDVRGARDMLRAAHDGLRVVRPRDVDLQTIRLRLAGFGAALDDVDESVRLLSECAAFARRRLEGWTLSPRERGAMANEESGVVDGLLAFALGHGELEPQPVLVPRALLVSQTLRGAGTRAARGLRRARAASVARAGDLERELRSAAAEVIRAGRAGFGGPSVGTPTAPRPRDTDRLVRAIESKERLQRELAALARGAGHVETATATVVDLAVRLPARAAAAAIVGYEHWTPDREDQVRGASERRLVALLLDRGGRVTVAQLGALDLVERQVARLREGLDGEVGGTAARLRELVLDPVFARLGGDVTTLFVALDEALELVPLDALPGVDGAPVGTRLAIRPLVSLFELLDAAAVEVGAEPSLLALGDIDYDAELPAATERTVAPDVRGSGGSASFDRLRSSRAEVRRIAREFESVFEAGDNRVLTRDDADKSAFVAAAPRATFVHVATHGYFAESLAATASDRSTGMFDAFAPLRVVTGMSPLILSGLALSGANAVDEQRRAGGILTAEEMLALDLSRCYLVTLSACDTSLGVRRAGQGYASLRAALQGAGARHVLTSLWKVDDDATKDLMTDFYRRLWGRRTAPHRALWEARFAARERGAAFRDWAGWVLTGR